MPRLINGLFHLTNVKWRHITTLLANIINMIFFSTLIGRFSKWLRWYHWLINLKSNFSVAETAVVIKQMNQVKFTCKLEMLQKDSAGVITMNGDIQPVNATFEMSDEYISLVSKIFHNFQNSAYFETNRSLYVTNKDRFDQETQALVARDRNYILESNRLEPSELFLGEKVLIYLHANDFDVFNTFWYYIYFVNFSRRKP